MPAGPVGSRGHAPVVPPAAAAGSPAAAAKILGLHLRRLRTDRGLRMREVAPVIRASASKISRLERAESPPLWRDVMDLVVHAYGVADEAELEEVRELLRQATRPAWWCAYSDVMPGWLRRLISLEAAAAELRIWETMVVHGLLQTPDYTRALVRAAMPLAPEREVERRVELRLARQQVLRAAGRRLVVLLDEGILHRPVGGAPVMLGQLRRLREFDDVPGVSLRVVTFERSAGVICPTPVTHLRFEAGGPPEVVCLEHAEGATYVAPEAERAAYRRLLEQLTGAAEDRAGTLALLDRMIAEYERRSG